VATFVLVGSEMGTGPLPRTAYLQDQDRRRRASKRYAVLGATMGFGGHRQEGLTVVGLLQTVGKVRVLIEILVRSNKLMLLEFQVIPE